MWLKTLIPTSTDDQTVHKHLPSKQAASFKDLWKTLKMQRCLKHEYCFPFISNIIGNMGPQPERSNHDKLMG